MRWAVAIAVAALTACATVSLDVGRDDRPSTEVDAASDAAADADVATPSLLERLRARCAAAAGPADYYENAAALSSRVVGRWYYCPDRGNWATPPEGLELSLAPAPTWAFLSYDGDGGFVAATDDLHSGPLRYVAPIGAVDGGAEEEVAPSDSTPRNGIELALDRTEEPLRFIPDFEKDPRLMQLRELGGDPARGVFVPID